MMMVPDAPGLYCELCNFESFQSYAEFLEHHKQHIRPCSVPLVKLNDSLVHKLQHQSYRVNTGVARRSANSPAVTPLKISLRKEKGGTSFEVVKAQSSEEPSDSDDDFFESVQKYLEKTANHPKSDKSDGEGKESKAVEGKKLLERLGAGISFSRKPTKVKDEPSDEDVETKPAEKPTGKVPGAAKGEKEKLLERLSGIGGISIAAKPKQVTNGAGQAETKQPPGVVIASKTKSIDISQLKKLKEPAEADAVEKKPFDTSSLLEKLSGFGGISFASKSPLKPKVEEKEAKAAVPEPPETAEASASDEEYDEDEDEEEEDSEDDKPLRPEKPPAADQPAAAETEKKPADTEELSGTKDSVALNAEVQEKTEQGSQEIEVKRHVRVKNSTVSKKEIELKTLKAKEEAAAVAAAASRGTDQEQEPEIEAEKDKTESGIDILERLTGNLSSTVRDVGHKEGTTPAREDPPKPPPMDAIMAQHKNLPPSPTPSEQLHPDFIAPARDSPTGTEVGFPLQTAGQQDQQDCGSLIITPPNSTDSNAGYSGYQTEEYNPALAVSSPTAARQHGDPLTTGCFQNVGDPQPAGNMPGSFSAIHGDGQSLPAGEGALEQPNYWGEVGQGAPGMEQPQQDPLMTADGGAGGGEAMSNALRESLLQNFLNDTQTQPNLPAEGSEYMSLERLGQGMEQELDHGAPMEQLTQQVQRMPNPTPQINVIPHHHMQAPQHPQLPQHPHPGQPPPFDQLNHMQPPMPPLYQGYNMFNQNFAPQTPQTPPRPPMLQQRPQIQARSFQSMAAPPRQRPRFGVKRSLVRLPPPLDGTPPKQRRPEPPMQGRMPQQNTSPAKLPSGVTITPPKKTQEANKVANVLASRGITVTPAAGRQQPQQPQQGAMRSPQRGPPPLPSAVLNIGSGVSITSNQGRGSGGFAVPGPARRNAPIVNHHVERPERCTTVDLTLDDDPPPPRNRGTIGRFSCNQCTKIFTSSVALETHKSTHRAAGTLAYKCERCTAQYPTAQGLQQHKVTFHKAKQVTPDLAIPIVDLNHPGAKEQLSRCGIHSFLPLSQLQSNSNGYFGIPIINIDQAKEKAVSNLNTLGASNIFVLGKMKSLLPQAPQGNR